MSYLSTIEILIFGFNNLVKHLETYNKKINIDIEKFENKPVSEFSLSDKKEILYSYFLTPNHFEQMQCNALTLFIYGHFENILDELCISHEDSSKGSIKLKDLHGRGVDRAVLYLSKVAKINGLYETKSWAEIQKWNILRNCIIHNGGIIHKAKDIENLKEILYHKKDSDDYYIVLRFSNIRSFIATVEEFLTLIYNSIILE